MLVAFSFNSPSPFPAFKATPQYVLHSPAFGGSHPPWPPNTSLCFSRMRWFTLSQAPVSCRALELILYLRSVLSKCPPSRPTCVNPPQTEMPPPQSCFLDSPAPQRRSAPSLSSPSIILICLPLSSSAVSDGNRLCHFNPPLES